MRKLFLILAAAALTLGWGCSDSAKGPVKSPKAKHVVIIGLDAMSPRGMQKAVTPNMNRIIAEGASCFNGRCILSPASTQNWTTMLTGAVPVQHGVTSNPWQRDNRRIQPAITGAEDVFPSVFEWVREQRPDSKIHFYHEWKNVIRMFSKSVMNVVEHTKTGDEAMRKAMDAFVTEKPDLLYIHILETDHVGHVDGHDTEAYYSAIEKYDAYIGEFMQKIEDAGMWNETLMLVVADHGGFLGTHSGESADAIEIPIMLYGKGVARNKTISNYFIFDVAPTVAWAMGLEYPDVCAGKPLYEAFTNDNKTFRYAPMPRLSRNGALLSENSIELTMSADWPGAEIYYTMDGTNPTVSSPKYSGPITIDKNTIVKAVSVSDGYVSGMAREHYRFKKESAPRVSYALYKTPDEIYVPDFKGMQPAVRGKTHEISLDGILIQENNFSVHYKAKFEVPAHGKYRFHTRSDDGCWLKVDGKLVTRTSTSHFQETYGDVELAKGIHDIEVGYRQDIKRKHMSIFIAGPGVEAEEELLTNKFFR